MNARYLTSFGVTRSYMIQDFLEPVPRDAKILEIGASSGVQLQLLAQEGFTDLTAVDIAPDVLAFNHWPSITADATHLPFADCSFDLVFTSGTLMTIVPDLKPQVMREMNRISRRWIWGFEMWHQEMQTMKYWLLDRGASPNDLVETCGTFHSEWTTLMPDAWVQDYSSLFEVVCNDLRLLFEMCYAPLYHVMYLLERKTAPIQIISHSLVTGRPQRKSASVGGK